MGFSFQYLTLNNVAFFFTLSPIPPFEIKLYPFRDRLFVKRTGLGVWAEVQLVKNSHALTVAFLHGEPWRNDGALYFNPFAAQLSKDGANLTRIVWPQRLADCGTEPGGVKE